MSKKRTLHVGALLALGSLYCVGANAQPAANEPIVAEGEGAASEGGMGSTGTSAAPPAVSPPPVAAPQPQPAWPAPAQAPAVPQAGSTGGQPAPPATQPTVSTAAPAQAQPAATSPTSAPAPAAAVAPEWNAEEADSEPRIDVQGSWGFGAGLAGGTGAAPVTLGNDLNLRVWVTDMLALQPSLLVSVHYDDATQVTAYQSSPQFEVLFALLRGQSNRINLGVGLRYVSEGVTVGSNDSSGGALAAPSSSGFSSSGAVPSTTAPSVDSNRQTISIPLDLELEHFFASWFSVQVGARCTLAQLITQKVGELDPQTSFATQVDSTRLRAGFMFYTD